MLIEKVSNVSVTGGERYRAFKISSFVSSVFRFCLLYTILAPLLAVEPNLRGDNIFKSFQMYLCMYSLFSYLLTCYIKKKLRRLKIYLLKGEKSSSAEMDIVFTELLLAGRMK